MRAMFFSSIAHELRTPLNSIIPMIKMILLNFLSSIDERVKNYLKIILNSSLHLQNVIEDALDMSRIENNKFTIFKEMFDIREAVKEVSSIMEFQTSTKNIYMRIKVDELVPEKILCDQKRYKQILFNLIGNAVKFTFTGGIKVRVKFQNNDLITEIEDTGIGIKEEDLHRLFKFFGQISKSKHLNRGGMGLGLTISKMILQ
jgi:signal transduction histidine kinase